MPTVKAHLADATALDRTEEGTEDSGLVDAIALAITLHSYAIRHRDAYKTVGTRLSSSRFRTSTGVIPRFAARLMTDIPF